MANFLTSVLSSGRVKEGFDKGSQGVASALLYGMPEGFATKFLGFRTLSGVGLINPLLGIFTEPAYSAIKELAQSGVRTLLGKQPAVTLPSVSTDTPATDPVVAVGQEIISRLPGGGILFRQPPRTVQSTLLQKFPVLRGESKSVLGSPGTPPWTDSLEYAKERILVSPFPSHKGVDPLSHKDFSSRRTFADRKKDDKQLNKVDLKHTDTKRSVSPSTLPGKGNPFSHKDFSSNQSFKGRERRFDSYRRMGIDSIRRYLELKDQGREDVSGERFEEFLQQNRFFISDETNDNMSVFEWSMGDVPKTLAAGFSYCSAPTMTFTVEEVKEGTWEFPRSILTGVEAGRITLQKGMVYAPTSFYLWLINAIAGKLTRRTIWVVSYGRAGRDATEVPSPGPDKVFDSSKLPWSLPGNIVRESRAIWKLVNCIPIGYKAGQDWDARSGEIQISELEIAYEWFEELAGSPSKRTSR